ncbi:winged helix-turn-helix transcriptional regulator [Nocardia aurantia]|uniref:Putative HTH-type transcriptional regulator YybR n=1 Tax=Nocardia aurantia TaxID=2585199 RepID=A0A7K0DPK8_9NOCA|nr:helix-turn-helix domain-containing protein [Nocardia aurantia]MQY27322.1 putative HTH-type transcriptional regulator YybR [Nocardia aurantia]
MKVSNEVAGVPAGLPDIFPAGCPSRMVLEHVTSKWGVLVLIALSEGEQRWGDLRRRADGVSEKMLAQTLKTLERDGLVNRSAQATIPPRVDYSLTGRGYEVSALLVPLATWAYRNADDIINGQR